MKRLYKNNLNFVIAVLVTILLSLPAFGQINVTVRLNTATNPDTLTEHHYVDVRGECSGDNLPGITWSDDTGIIMQNVGGDYWETTFQMTTGDTLRFKFWTGFNDSTQTLFNWGWEGPINPANTGLGGDSRSFIAGSQDTTLPIQFYHGIETARDQFWKPYEAKTDSFAVYYRVNMAALMETGEFDPAGDGPVQAQGGAPLDPDDGWDTPVVLTQETGSVNSGSFFSGVNYIAVDSVAGGEWQNFKFTYMKDGSEVWESIDNRYFQYSAAKDTTIHWAYFNDQAPSGGNLVEATLTWQVKTDGLEKLGLFDREIDRVVIDGAKAWDIDNPIEMNYVPLTQLWLGEESFIKAPGATLEYKAVVLWDDSRADDTSPNYIPGLDLEVPLQYWEEPCVTGSGNRFYDYSEETAQLMPGDYGFDYQYFNGLPAEGVIETPLTITFNIDMTPATDEETNPANPLFRPGVDSCEVQFYGCLLPLTQGYGLYDSTKIIKLEDPDGDLVYTGSWELTPPTTFAAGYVVNYSSESGTIQNGGGFTEGRSYYQFVQPEAVHEDGTIDWPEAYVFPTLEWKDSDLPVEDPPDLWAQTGIHPEEDATAIRVFKLSQNYPNPFNPETTVEYQVAANARVQIDIYNLMGQRIITLVDKQQPQGVYSIQWNGKDRHGHSVPSGVYFLKMAAGNFQKARKMILIR